MQRPAVVAALDDAVDLLPAEVAHVAAVELPGGAVELEAPGIAESVGPDRPELAGLAGERIVGRDRTVLVDPQDLPVRIAQVLRVRPVAVVADCEVQLAVRSEPNAPADVEQLRRRRGPEQLVRAVGADVVGRAEPDQVVQQIVPGVIEVDVVIGLPKSGSNAIPISPRSPVSSDGRSAKGVDSSCPFFTILIFPARSRMKIRPSGAISNPTGRSGHRRRPARSGSRLAARRGLRVQTPTPGP